MGCLLLLLCVSCLLGAAPPALAQSSSRLPMPTVSAAMRFSLASPPQNPKVTTNHYGGKTETTTDAQGRVTLEIVKDANGKLRDKRQVMYDDKEKTETEYNEHFDELGRMTNDNNSNKKDGKVVRAQSRDWVYKDDKDRDGKPRVRVWDPATENWRPVTMLYGGSHWGVLGGLTLASLSSNDDQFQPHDRLGLVGGAQWSWDFGDDDDDDPWDFVLDLLAATKGARFAVGPDDEVVGAKYLDVIPSFRYRIFEQPNYNVHVAVGPSIGWKWAERTTFKGQTLNTPDFAKSMDFGLSFMGGIELSHRFSTGFRYTHGLTNIVKTPGTSGLVAHNRIFQLMFGYEFGR